MGTSEPLFENLIGKKRLAESLAVSVSFVEKMMREEGLPHVKLGKAVRFRLSEVQAWLQRRSRA